MSQPKYLAKLDEVLSQGVGNWFWVMKQGVGVVIGYDD